VVQEMEEVKVVQVVMLEVDLVVDSHSVAMVVRIRPKI
jgi:hypothetical protein